MSELARYPVRTPMWLWLSNGALTSFCVLVVGAMFMFGGRVPGAIILLASVLVGATIAFWLTMSAYRVGGGRNLIRFYDDRIEVPSITKRQPLVFPREGTRVEISDVLVRYRLGIAGTVATVNRGKLLSFRHGTTARKLSTLVLDDSDAEPALLADLRRFAAGEPALGVEGHAKAVPPRDEYDDRLDRELAQLD
jgi:hypothetical protein